MFRTIYGRSDCRPPLFIRRVICIVVVGNIADHYSLGRVRRLFLLCCIVCRDFLFCSLGRVRGLVRTVVWEDLSITTIWWEPSISCCGWRHFISTTVRVDLKEGFVLWLQIFYIPCFSQQDLFVLRLEIFQEVLYRMNQNSGCLYCC